MLSSELVGTLAEEFIRSIKDVASSLRDLGNADAATPMGAIEGHAVKTVKAGEAVALSMAEVSKSINNVSISLDSIAKSIQNLADNLWNK